MPKSSVSSSSVKNEKSTFARLYVADEFRVEQSGKLLVIGLYADGVVVMRVPKNAPKPTKETPYGMDVLSLLVVIGGFIGEEMVRISIGKSEVVERQVTLQPGRSTNLHMVLRPFTFAAFGIKEMLLEFAGTTHKLQFEIRPEYVDPVDDLSAFMSVISRSQPAPPQPTGLKVTKKAVKVAPRKTSRKT